jgi:hypothetical protein
LIIFYNHLSRERRERILSDVKLTAPALKESVSLQDVRLSPSLRDVTFLWIPRVASAGWRDFLREVTSLLTGHGHFNKRLFSLGLSDTPSYVCGEEEWGHLLWDSVATESLCIFAVRVFSIRLGSEEPLDI